jgi:twitching motility protein PilT
MRLPDLDKILSAMLHTHPGISDLNFSVGHPLQVESFGELKPALTDPPIDLLTPYQTEQIALALMQGDRRLMYDYLSGGSCDLSYALSDEARFRVNIFRQRGNFAIVLRRLEAAVPTLETLQLPGIFRDIAKEKTGLVLVTGATGSGKTTTLAAILNEINETQGIHVVTLEDPIEFVHPCRKATFNQRELGQDFNNYPNGLRAALRQAPKVILIGEMRDYETTEIALEAAETGHLVLSTLHTIDASKTIDRIIGLYPKNEEPVIRTRLAQTFRYIVSQRLIPRADFRGRVAAVEILRSTPRTREYIEHGESEGKSLLDAMRDGKLDGMQDFDSVIKNMIEQETVSMEDGLAFATNQNNLLLSLRGLTSSDDFIRTQSEDNMGTRAPQPAPSFMMD